MLRVLFHSFGDLLFYSLDFVLDSLYECFEGLVSLGCFWLGYLFSLSVFLLLVLHMASHLGGETWHGHKRLGSAGAFLVIEELWTPNEKNWLYVSARLSLLFLILPKRLLDAVCAMAARRRMIRRFLIFFRNRLLN